MAIIQRPFEARNGDNLESNISWLQKRHLACVFLLDTSESMLENDAIGKLNEGLRVFYEQVANTSSPEYLEFCLDVALISFGPDVKVQQDFIAVNKMVLPTLKADGGTPMGAAIHKALDMIAEQKVKYKGLGIPYYRPWVLCITDGEPNDSYTAAAQRLKQMEDAGKVCGYCVGVANFNQHTMANIFNTNNIFELKNLNFSALFNFGYKVFAPVKYDSQLLVELPEDLERMSDLEW